jgi:hypothetical protein
VALRLRDVVASRRLLGWALRAAVSTTAALMGAPAPASPLPGPGIYAGTFELPGALQKIGRTSSVVRIYSNWNDPQPTVQMREAVAAGQTPIISIASRSSTHLVTWRRIASGAEDAAIKAQAAGIASLGHPVLLALDHEPTLEAPQSGTAADYVAAWRHYVQVFRSAGVHNVRFDLILTSRTYDPSAIGPWYPGDTVVDYVGVDGYNGNGCNTASRKPNWQSFDAIFASAHAFAIAHHKPMSIAEWASNEDPTNPGAKAAWITQAMATMASWPQIRAAVYFSTTPKPACDWPLTSSPQALAAYVAAANAAPFDDTPQAFLRVAGPPSGVLPETVTFATSRTSAGLAGGGAWRLDFGDGSPPATGTGTPAGPLRHAYGPGTFTATFTETNATGQSAGAQATVVVLDAPHVTLGPRAWKGATAIVVSGRVFGSHQATAAWFEYGPTTAYGSRTPTIDLPATAPPKILHALLSHLPPGSDVHYRFVAANPSGTAYSPDGLIKVPK